jgi:hypothetical protein
LIFIKLSPNVIPCCLLVFKFISPIKAINLVTDLTFPFRGLKRTLSKYHYFLDYFSWIMFSSLYITVNSPSPIHSVIKIYLKSIDNHLVWITVPLATIIVAGLLKSLQNSFFISLKNPFFI